MFNNILPKIIKNYPDRINWNAITSNPGFTMNMVDKYKHKFTNRSWHNLCANPYVDFNYIENLILTTNLYKINWSDLSGNINLPLWFIEKYHNKLSWNLISEFNANLNIEFIKKYAIYINFEMLSYNDYIDINIIIYLVEHDTYSKYLNWAGISRNINLPVNFIEEHFNKLNKKYLIMNHNLSFNKINYLISNWDKEDNDEFTSGVNWFEFIGRCKLTTDLLEKYHDEIFDSMLGFDPDIMCSNITFTKEIYEHLIDIRYDHVINLDIMSENPNIDMQFVDEFNDYLNFDELCYNQFNYHPYIFIKNKNIYSKKIEIELNKEIDNRKIRKEIQNNKIIYELCIHEFKMRLRDLSR